MRIDTSKVSRVPSNLEVGDWWFNIDGSIKELVYKNIAYQAAKFKVVRDVRRLAGLEHVSIFLSVGGTLAQ